MPCNAYDDMSCFSIYNTRGVTYGLEKELGEVKASLLKESDEHDTLCIAIQLVYDDLQLALE